MIEDEPKEEKIKQRKVTCAREKNKKKDAPSHPPTVCRPTRNRRVPARYAS